MDHTYLVALIRNWEFESGSEEEENEEEKREDINSPGELK